MGINGLPCDDPRKARTPGAESPSDITVMTGFADHYAGAQIQQHDVLDVIKEAICAHLVAIATGCQAVLWERQNPRDRSGSRERPLQ